jgi:hypothetical protein
MCPTIIVVDDLVRERRRDGLELAGRDAGVVPKCGVSVSDSTVPLIIGQVFGKLGHDHIDHPAPHLPGEDGHKGARKARVRIQYKHEPMVDTVQEAAHRDRMGILRDVLPDLGAGVRELELIVDVLGLVGRQDDAPRALVEVVGELGLAPDPRLAAEDPRQREVVGRMHERLDLRHLDLRVESEVRRDDVARVGVGRAEVLDLDGRPGSFVEPVETRFCESVANRRPTRA